MDPAILERLMIDDALGGLPPDVSALLAAFTAARPADEAELSQWRKITNLASRAAEPLTPEKYSLPAFPRRRILAFQVRRFALAGAAMAACLLLGFYLNAWMTPSSQPPAPIVGSPIAIVASPAPLLGVHNFWSSQRLLATALSQPATSAPGTRWLPLPGQPKIGGVQ